MINYTELETTKNIIQEIKEKQQGISIDFDYWNTIEDDGYTLKKNIVIFCEEITDDIIDIYERNLQGQQDIAVYIRKDIGMLKNYSNNHFSKVYARTRKDVEIDINREIDSILRENIYKEVSQLEEYKNYDETIFSTFQEQYIIEYTPKKYNDYEAFLNEIEKKAWVMKDNNSNLVQGIKSFLHSIGVILLVKEKKDVPNDKIDGLCGYVGEKKIPTIIVYRGDDKNLRRCFFTIAHELYHLFYNEGEHSANTFAGSLLISEKDVQDINRLQDNKDEEVATTIISLYNKFGVSIECCINALFHYQKISKEQRKIFLRKKKKKLIEKIHKTNSNENNEWIYQSLGLRH